MNERIKQIRKDQRLTLEKFGERIGVTKATMSRIENGVNSVTEQMVRSICREFHVNEDWLRTGSGNSYDDTLENTVQKLAEEYDLHDIELTVLTEYLNLDAPHREAFRDFMFNVVMANKKKQEAAPTAAEPLPVDGRPEPTVEELEEAYKKSRLNSAHNTDASASNMSGARGA